MSRFEGQPPQPTTHLELKITPSLRSLLEELQANGVEDPDIIKNVVKLDKGGRYKFQTPTGVYNIEHFENGSYSLVSCDEEEKVDLGFEKERTIFREVFKQQLEFVHLLHTETQRPIADLIKEYTNFIDTIGFDLRVGESEEGVIAGIKEQLIADLSALEHPESPDWSARAWQLFLDVYTKLEVDHQPASPDGLEPRLYGVIYQLRGADEQSKAAYQLESGTQHLNLHFAIRAVEVARGNKLLTPKAALREVARLIREQQVPVAAITGSSWLMSLPTAERLGFEKLSTSEHPWHEMGYWLQLVDEHGNIKPSVVQELREKKRLPYDYTHAKIPIDKFLELYQ